MKPNRVILIFGVSPELYAVFFYSLNIDEFLQFHKKRAAIVQTAIKKDYHRIRKERGCKRFPGNLTLYPM